MLLTARKTGANYRSSLWPICTHRVPDSLHTSKSNNCSVSQFSAFAGIVVIPLAVHAPVSSPLANRSFGSTFLPKVTLFSTIETTPVLFSPFLFCNQRWHRRPSCSCRHCSHPSPPHPRPSPGSQPPSHGTAQGGAGRENRLHGSGTGGSGSEMSVTFSSAQ